MEQDQQGKKLHGKCKPKLTMAERLAKEDAKFREDARVSRSKLIEDNESSRLTKDYLNNQKIDIKRKEELEQTESLIGQYENHLSKLVENVVRIDNYICGTE